MDDAFSTSIICKWRSEKIVCPSLVRRWGEFSSFQIFQFHLSIKPWQLGTIWQHFFTLKYSINNSSILSNISSLALFSLPMLQIFYNLTNHPHSSEYLECEQCPHSWQFTKPGSRFFSLHSLEPSRNLLIFGRSKQTANDDKIYLLCFLSLLSTNPKDILS